MESSKPTFCHRPGGNAGLRAAIALAETDPKLHIALISKVYPCAVTCAAEGRPQVSVR